MGEIADGPMEGHTGGLDDFNVVVVERQVVVENWGVGRFDVIVGNGGGRIGFGGMRYRCGEVVGFGVNARCWVSRMRWSGVNQVEGSGGW